MANKALRQGILVDAVVLAQYGYYRKRHLGIVGIRPRWRGQRTKRQQPLDAIWVHKEALAEGIADRETFKRQAGTSETILP